MGWIIYLISICDDVNVVAGTLMVLSLVTFIGCSLIWIRAVDDFSEDQKKFLKKIHFLAARALAISVIIGVFIPDTKQMAAIYVIPKVAENEKVQEIGDGLMGLADEWIKELSPKKEEASDNN